MIKNFKKRDIAYLWIIIISFIAIAFAVSNTMYKYGSQLDWYAQHVQIADYFRTLFYSTKDLIPDFAANIGSGQNIYNFSYYGFLSPILLISYLLPKVPMDTYIMVSTCISIEIAAILLYFFIRNKNYSSEASLIAVLSFILSAPIVLHSHRHIMFITNMPFIILGLFGVDKKLEKNKGWLLSLSVFLMIMTNYYFSIGGIMCLIIYGIYRYLSNVNKVTIKNFFKTGFNFLLPILIAVLSSCIITLPTFATLLFNRADSNISITLLDILKLGLHTEYLMNDGYGLGLTAISLFALVNFIDKKKENIFLGVILSLFIVSPLFNYILNGTMYIDAKSLIPFLPLYCLLIANLIDRQFNKKINYKIMIPATIVIILLVLLNKDRVTIILSEIGVIALISLLYNKFEKKYLITIPLIIMIVISGYNVSKNDELVLKYTAEDNENEVRNLVNEITDNDKTFYRIANNFNVSETPNLIYQNINYYNTTIYSSISNQDYNKLYYDVLNNNIPSRNRALTVTTPNIMSLMLMNNKYLISRNKPLQGYELVDVDDSGMYIYKNDNTLPLGFASSNIMSYTDFNKLNNPTKQEALLNVIVADAKTDNKYASSINEIKLDWDEILKDTNYELKDGHYIIKVDDTLKITYNLPEEYKNKILFIEFNMNNSQSCSDGDTVIRINNVKNKLTCKSWKYHNENYLFDYVLADKEQSKLTITFQKGEYDIDDIKTYILDYATLENVSKNVDAFNITKIKGDIIEGNIDVTNDGYFMLTIPYDNGFNIKVDGKQVDYEKVDEAYIGFKITNGKHDISIEYKAPYKDMSLLISTIGILSFIIVTILESKRKIN